MASSRMVRTYHDQEANSVINKRVSKPDGYKITLRKLITVIYTRKYTMR